MNLRCTTHSACRKSIGLFGIAMLAATLSFGSAHAQEQRPVVEVAKAEMTALGARAEFIGRVEADKKVELRSRVQGFLRQVAFSDGDDVTRDQLLFEIEPEPFQAALVQRKAAVASAKASQKEAELDLERKQTLRKSDTVPQSALDDSVAKAAQAEAAVQQAAAAQQDAEINLSYTQIRAPFNGRIGRSNYDEGNLIGPESGVLATVVKSDPAKVLFEVPQRQLLNVRSKVGDKPVTVRVRLANGEVYKYDGKIDFMDVTVNSRTDGQLMQAEFANPDAVLVDGQTTRVMIEEAQPDQVLTVPMIALSADQTGSFVLLVNDQDEVERRTVKVGINRDGVAEITEGLSEGDRVIVNGQLKVQTGMKVDARLAGSSQTDATGG